MLRGDRYVYIAENRSYAGRASVAEDEATGRYLSKAWCSPGDRGPDGVVVKPDGGTTSLPLELYTIAELSRAAGYFPTVPTGATTRAVELLHENAIMTHGLLRLSGQRLDDYENPWSFMLSGRVDAEEAHADERFDEMTKMALARQIQIRDGLSDDRRNAIWKQDKDFLI